MIIVKTHDVMLGHLTEKAAYALGVIDGVFEKYGNEVTTVTATTNGKHSLKSKHWEGNAFDLRIRGVKRVTEIVEESRDILGKDYDIIYGYPNHTDHIHVEHDPK